MSATMRKVASSIIRSRATLAIAALQRSASSLAVTRAPAPLAAAARACAPRRTFAAGAGGAVDVKVPGMGDSITNGTIVAWQKSA